MIKRYAVVNNDLVINIILLEQDNYDTYIASQNNFTFVELDDSSEVSIGWSYLNNEFVSNQPLETNESLVLEQVLQVANT